MPLKYTDLAYFMITGIATCESVHIFHVAVCKGEGYYVRYKYLLHGEKWYHVVSQAVQCGWNCDCLL